MGPLHLEVLIMVGVLDGAYLRRVSTTRHHGHMADIVAGNRTVCTKATSSKHLESWGKGVSTVYTVASYVYIEDRVQCFSQPCHHYNQHNGSRLVSGAPRALFNQEIAVSCSVSISSIDGYVTRPLQPQKRSILLMLTN